MKNLVSKIAKGVGMAGIVLGSFFSKAEAQELNGPTPWEILGNTYSQPNITKQIGKGDLEWYGSGDVNNDGKIDQEDLNAMNQGAQNIMADVNGDGHFSTQNDKTILSEYLNGQRNYLPGHWNELTTPEEREAWFDKMFRLQDRLNGSPTGWICQDWIRQHELDFYGTSNYIEGYNQGFWKPETNIDSVAKYNLPMYFFETKNTAGISHAVDGVLVGRRINADSVSLNPLDFRDWSFRSYQQDERIYPGDFDIDPNSPVKMKKLAYVQNRGPPFNKYFNLTGPWIEWELDNGNATLTSYWADGPLLLENPNIIKVHVGELEDIVLNGGNVLPNQTSLTPEILEGMGYNGVPDTTKENTNLPINLEYTDRDTTWSADSTSFAYDRDFHAWIYSGGVTKRDSTTHNIKVEDLIGPNTSVSVGSLDSLVVNAQGFPAGFNFTPEALDSLGYNAIPDTSKENTNLPINLTYTNKDTTWHSPSSYSFNRDFHAYLYSFGDTLTDGPSSQNIRVDNVTDVGDLEHEVRDFEIYQNYPNPFNPSTTIKYYIPELSKVNLKVYNILGEEVKTLVEKVEPSGEYNVNFDASGLASGVYIYKFDADSDVSDKKYTSTGKMILVK